MLGLAGQSDDGLLSNRDRHSRGLEPHRADHRHCSDEMTLAQLFKQKNYATAIFGKWHLGHHPQFLPTRHGFDEYFGLPYSNDMWPLHPYGGQALSRLCR